MSAPRGIADVIRTKADSGFDAALQQQMAAGLTGIPGALLFGGGYPTGLGLCVELFPFSSRILRKEGHCGACAALRLPKFRLYLLIFFLFYIGILANQRALPSPDLSGPLDWPPSWYRAPAWEQRLCGTSAACVE